MRACVYAFAAVASIALCACDLSQTKPETMRTALSRVFAPGAAEVRRAPAEAERDSAAPRLGITTTDRSIRLYGPGVSRKRQTRV
jgi:hypothetical protein